ncbi:sigma-70 family RNA polymerase sigma factor [Cryomorpha ignava]|uniref:RNA polymerase sigma factor n=1 Tax=Cryomorpha ignava TaxID=101383 RepID=A0A7K3WTM9_9FLAO|nr:sigma-70 family RNA polymerase sigma factor [Cryomorpha ignava]NEN24844.1 sigma-70 family RNA polymerase sigma factor [Cryomorpha ignava]
MYSGEKELIKRLKDKKSRNAAFDLLVKTYQQPLYYHIRRMVGNHQDADDVLQNTFIKVWRFIGDFKEESKLYTWLYRIASNEALGFLRAQRAKPSGNVDAETHVAATTDGPDGDSIERKLGAALQTLPDKQRQVFDLKYFSELKYEEISEITGTSVGALKASYFHAVKKIEVFLKTH